MVLRGLFIGGGLVLIDKFHALVVLFGGFLVYSSYQLLVPGADGDDDDDLSDNAIVKWASVTFNATSDFDGGRLFTRRGMGDVASEGGGLLATLGRPTPLLLVLVCIELSDILFAVDSIPAVFGVTSDPFIAFTSNIFAIIGLRSLYSVLASAVQDLVRAPPRGSRRLSALRASRRRPRRLTSRAAGTLPVRARRPTLNGASPSCSVSSASSCSRRAPVLSSTQCSRLAS